MALILIQESRPATVTYSAIDYATLTGPSDKIQIKAPADSTLLNEGPAAGKTWTVTVSVHIIET